MFSPLGESVISLGRKCVGRKCDYPLGESVISPWKKKDSMGGTYLFMIKYYVA